MKLRDGEKVIEIDPKLYLMINEKLKKINHKDVKDLGLHHIIIHLNRCLKYLG